jgi:hypothetical protein
VGEGVRGRERDRADGELRDRKRGFLPGLLHLSSAPLVLIHHEFFGTLWYCLIYMYANRLLMYLKLGRCSKETIIPQKWAV